MARTKTSGKAQESQSSTTGDGGIQNGGIAGSERGQISAASSERDSALSNDEIAARAYEIYERDGRSDGHAMDHWLQAESELRDERQRKTVGAQSPQSRQELPRSARIHQESPSI